MQKTSSDIAFLHGVKLAFQAAGLHTAYAPLVVAYADQLEKTAAGVVRNAIDGFLDEGAALRDAAGNLLDSAGGKVRASRTGMADLASPDHAPFAQAANNLASGTEAMAMGSGMRAGRNVAEPVTPSGVSFDFASADLNPQQFNPQQFNPQQLNPRLFEPMEFNPQQFDPTAGKIRKFRQSIDSDEPYFPEELSVPNPQMLDDIPRAPVEQAVESPGWLNAFKDSVRENPKQLIAPAVGLGLGAGGIGYGMGDADTAGNKARRMSNEMLGTNFDTQSRLSRVLGG